MVTTNQAAQWTSSAIKRSIISVSTAKILPMHRCAASTAGFVDEPSAVTGIILAASPQKSTLTSSTTAAQIRLTSYGQRNRAQNDCNECTFHVQLISCWVYVPTTALQPSLLLNFPSAAQPE